MARSTARSSAGETAPRTARTRLTSTIHHSSDPKHADKNLAQIFNFWDRLAGTLYLPAEEEAISFGLSGGEHAKYRTLTDLYVQPFRSLIARYRRRPAASGLPS